MVHGLANSLRRSIGLKRLRGQGYDAEIVLRFEQRIQYRERGKSHRTVSPAPL